MLTNIKINGQNISEDDLANRIDKFVKHTSEYLDREKNEYNYLKVISRMYEAIKKNAEKYFKKNNKLIEFKEDEFESFLNKKFNVIKGTGYKREGINYKKLSNIVKVGNPIENIPSSTGHPIDEEDKTDKAEQEKKYNDEINNPLKNIVEKKAENYKRVMEKTLKRHL